MDQNTPDLRGDVVRVCKLLFDLQYLAGTGGNVSLKLPDGSFLVTPTKVNKGFLELCDVVRVDEEMNVLEGERVPSMECAMHLGVYRKIPYATAVIHAHPPYSTAFAIASQPIKTAYAPESYIYLGAEVPIVPYATPSSQALADNIFKALVPDAPAYLLQNHGVLVYGKDLQDAFNRLQILELYAQQLTFARIVGNPKMISQVHIDDMRRVFKLNF